MDTHKEGETGQKTGEAAKKTWEWYPNIYDLKVFHEDSYFVWNCSPYIMICPTDPPDSDPELVVNIEMKRVFKWAPSPIGWNWHKSWNIPRIVVSVSVSTIGLTQLFDKLSMEEMELPLNLEARLFAVKLISAPPAHPHFLEVKIIGDPVQELKHGKAVFDGLRFESTSYNHQGSKFHLILLITFKEEIVSVSAPKVLFSKISPPIFVDSRVAARNKKGQHSKQSSQNLEVEAPLSQLNPGLAQKSANEDLFDPSLLSATYVKRVKGKGRKETEDPISNSLKGLHDYFTAPNIRIYIPKLAAEGANKKKLIQLVHEAIQGLSGDQFYLLLWGEVSTQTLDYIKVVFPQLKALCSSRIEITLDADNIPLADYTKVEFGTQFLLAYNEYYLSNPQAGQAKSVDQTLHDDEAEDDEGEEGMIGEKLDTKPFESIFRITGESMEQEYQLTTLAVGKKKTVNLKQVVLRRDHEIKESDVMEFEPECSLVW